MASHTTRSRLAIIAALMLAAFMTQLPAFAEDASAPAPAAPDMGTSAAPFDPYAAGVSSDGVLYGPEARATGWTCFGRRATIVGTSHVDRIYGTKNQDVIVGLGGSDIISSGQKNDRICGGYGDDQIYGLDGNDFLNGDDGNDLMFGGTGDDRMLGRAGDDTMNGEGGTDLMFGAGGEDTINGGSAGDAEETSAPSVRGLGGDSDDLIKGGPSNDTLNGGDGNDQIFGQGGNDTLQGDSLGAAVQGLANDRMVGGPGRDSFLGGPGADTMTGAGGDDIFSGEEGDDTVWGDGGLDMVKGGPGRDTVHGGSKSDVLNGEGEGDTLFGDGGDDILCGGPEVDTLDGGEQDDLISGEADGCSYATANILSVFSTDSDAENLITGGAGSDLCVSPSTLLSPQTRSCEGTAIIKLEVKIQGNGNVTSPSVGILNEFPIDCSGNGGTTSGVCAMFFLPSEVPANVTLTETPSGGSAFQGWSGPGTAGCGTNVTCPLVIDKNTTVTATFGTAVSLTVVVNGAGSVTGPGIACPGDCSETYAQGSGVSLNASAVPTSWVVSGPGISSGCTAGNTACNLSMTSTGSVTANLP